MTYVLGRAYGNVQVEDRHYLYQSQQVVEQRDDRMKIKFVGRHIYTFVCETFSCCFEQVQL